MTLAFSCEVVHEKLWKYVNICKSYGEKISGTFFMWTQCISICMWLDFFGWLLHKPLCAFCKILTVGCIWNFPFLYNIKFCYQVQYTQMYNMHFSFWLPVRDKIKVHWGCSQMLLNAAGMDINDKPSIESCEVAREGTFPLFNVWSHGSCCVWCLECDAVVTDNFGQVAFVSERRAFSF